jgi:hypothetical protein
MSSSDAAQLTASTLERVRRHCAQWPGSHGHGATEADIIHEETLLGRRLPHGLRQLLLEFGGLLVGPCPLYGTQRPEFLPDELFRISDVNVRAHAEFPLEDTDLVFSDDNGCPIFFSSSLEVLVYDHDFGGRLHLANSFEEFLTTALSRSQAVRTQALR